MSNLRIGITDPLWAWARKDSMADKKCGLCDHYKVRLTGPDKCVLGNKEVRSLTKACDWYANSVSDKKETGHAS